MGTTTDELDRLNALIEDQSALIEQLYAENTAANLSVQTLTNNNKHLSGANDKQKNRIIQLNRKVKQLKPSPEYRALNPDGNLATPAIASSLH